MALVQDPRLKEELMMLARVQPGGLRIFFRTGLDALGDVRRSLGDACARALVDPDVVLKALDGLPPATARSWDERDTAELVDHLCSTHQRHTAQFGRLNAVADAVEAQAPAPLPEFRRLRGQLKVMETELTAHMRKEEMILFPWLRAGRGRTAGQPIRVLEGEHEAVARLCLDLRSSLSMVTRDTAMLHQFSDELEGFMEDLVEHMHLENHTVFPRAIFG